MRRHYQQPKNTYTRPYLYAVVFDGYVVKGLIALLCAFFILHPAVPAFAADEEVAAPAAESTQSAEAEEVTREVDVEEVEEVVDEAPTEEAVVEADAEDQVSDIEPSNSDLNDVGTKEDSSPELTTEANVGEELETETETDTSTERASSTNDVPVTDDASSVIASTTPDRASTTASDTAESVPTAGGSAPDADVSAEPVASTTDTTQASITEEVSPEPELVEPDSITAEPEVTEDEIFDELEDTEATTTTPAVIYVERLANDPNLITFDIDNCASVGDGSFYCSDVTKAGDPAIEDAVFVGKDADGDTEIFITIDGETTQLSHNTYDDAAPDFDPISHTVVWHRLVDNSYRIVSYDLSEETEVELTDGSFNDMEPSHEAGMTVWQRWLNGNWEVVLFDGKAVTQLTDNTTHDIAPDIRNGFVMWNSTGYGGAKEVTVFEIATGLTNTIADGEGGQVSNPRFVLVYDTEFANGDIVTKGFNPETGEVEHLSALPADEPQDIPDSDSTGETRALIQNKSSNKSEAEETLDDLINTYKTNTATSSATSSDAANTAIETPVESATSSTSVATDIDMTPQATSTLPLTDFDLIVEPYSSATSTQVNDSATTSNQLQ